MMLYDSCWSVIEKSQLISADWIKKKCYAFLFGLDGPCLKRRGASLPRLNLGILFKAAFNQVGNSKEEELLNLK